MEEAAREAVGEAMADWERVAVLEGVSQADREEVEMAIAEGAHRRRSRARAHCTPHQRLR